MTALAKKPSPAELLNEDGWWTIFQFLNGNEMARVLGVSHTLYSIGCAADIWANPVSTITLPLASHHDDEVGKLRLFGEKIELDSRKLDERSDNIVFREAIKTIIFNSSVCPNLQSLTILQLPAFYHNILDLTRFVRKRESSGKPLKKLVLELWWLYKIRNSWGCGKELVQGLVTALPEEVEFDWVRSDPYETEMHPHYRDAIVNLISYNKSALKFTLPGCLWADNASVIPMVRALKANKTVQSLSFKEPYYVGVWYSADDSNSWVSSLTKMLTHPSLRNLSITDIVISDYKLNWCTKCSLFTALYFADPESFSKSTLETLHLELGREAPYGLLSVLHCVADMPQLHKFTLNWPDGGHSIPQQVSMERLREYLKTSEMIETYKERPKNVFYESQKAGEVVRWSTLETLFI
jgi:hypothetical protein